MNAVNDNHVVYHDVRVPKGKEDNAQNFTVYGLHKYTTYKGGVLALTSKGWSPRINFQEETAEDGK